MTINIRYVKCNLVTFYVTSTCIISHYTCGAFCENALIDDENAR